jgi:hypothetical protein
MTTTLDYTTIEPVPDAPAAQILASAESTLSRDWWCEPLSLRQRAHSKKLTGSTRLFLRDYTLPNGKYQLVPEEEEFLLICSDATFIVACLADWSAKFNLSWLLTMDENPVGEITGGEPSTQLTRLLDGFCSMTSLSSTRIPELLKKHAARKS